MNGLNADSLTDQDFISLRCPSCATQVDFLLTLAGTAQGCPCCVNPIVLPRRRGEAASKIPLPMKGESLGMRKEGHFRKDHWEDAAWGDSVHYAYLGEEYKQRVADSR